MFSCCHFIIIFYFSDFTSYLYILYLITASKQFIVYSCFEKNFEMWIFLFISQVLVQTQIELWSDPIERTPLCSQTGITGSGKRFERTIVWTMVWFLSDQKSIRSARSDHSLYSLDHGLGSVWSEVNSVWKVWSQSL